MEIVKWRISDNSLGNHIKEILGIAEKHINFSTNAFIAGGFARKLAHELFISKRDPDEWGKYFEYVNSGDKNSLRRTQGDIDVFMSAKCLLEDVYIKQHNDITPKPSIGGFAKDFSAKLTKSFWNFFKNSPSIDRLKLQFVDNPALRYDTIQACFEAFDLVNCRYALTKDEIGWILHYDRQALDLDIQHTVKINQNSSPFLAKRLIKYMTERGCEAGLHKESHELLSEWMSKAAIDCWSELFKDKKFETVMQKSILLLRAIELLSPENLVIFLGKWRTTKLVSGTDEYGTTIYVDWAKMNIEDFDVLHRPELEHFKKLQKNVMNNMNVVDRAKYGNQTMSI